MHKPNFARLAVLGTMIAIAPEALRAMPVAPAKPAKTITPADLAKIEAADRKRQMKQAKRLRLSNERTV